VVMGIYIDDYLIIAPSDAEVLKVYSDLQGEFEVTNEEPINECIRRKMERREDMTLKLSQPQIWMKCDSIIALKGEQHQP